MELIYILFAAAVFIWAAVKLLKHLHVSHKMNSAEARFSEWDKIPLNPIESHGLILQRGEVCYFYRNTTIARYKSVRAAMAYHGPVIRVPIVKGISYRAAMFSGMGSTSEKLVRDDNGVVYLTNKRIILRGEKKNNSVKLDRIVEFCYFYGDDSMRIDKETGPPIIFFGVGGDRFLYILRRLMSTKA